MKINWRKVRNYMEHEAVNQRDETGIVNMTTLAETAAYKFKIENELGNENSRIWELSMRTADKYSLC